MTKICELLSQAKRKNVAKEKQKKTGIDLNKTTGLMCKCLNNKNKTGIRVFRSYIVNKGYYSN